MKTLPANIFIVIAAIAATHLTSGLWKIIIGAALIAYGVATINHARRTNQ